MTGRGRKQKTQPTSHINLASTIKECEKLYILSRGRSSICCFHPRTQSLLGHVRLTRGSNSLTLAWPGRCALANPAYCPLLASPPLSSVVPREGVPPPYSGGHQPRMLFIPLSLYIHHTERLCSSVNAPRPEAESGSVCTYINTLLSSCDAFKDVSLICCACFVPSGPLIEAPTPPRK